MLGASGSAAYSSLPLCRTCCLCALQALLSYLDAEVGQLLPTYQGGGAFARGLLRGLQIDGGSAGSAAQQQVQDFWLRLGNIK